MTREEFDERAGEIHQIITEWEARQSDVDVASEAAGRYLETVCAGRYRTLPMNSTLKKYITSSLRRYFHDVLQEAKNDEHEQLDDHEDTPVERDEHTLVELRIDLERVLSKLKDPDTAQVIRDVYLEGYTLTECAERRGMLESTLRMRVQAAFKALRQYLDGYEEFFAN